MKHVPPDGLLPQLNEALARLFHTHGLESVPEGEWLVFREHGYRANARIVEEIENPKALILQLDFRFQLSGGKTVIESVGGWGKDVNAAVTEALHWFEAGIFPVLLASFFGRPIPGQVEQNQTMIDSRPRRVTTGNVTPWGRVPEIAPGKVDMRWFVEFNSRLKTKTLAPGTHWVRLYYCQSKGRTLECDVLLDNQPWSELQTEMAGIDWPKTEKYYSVRWFLVIQDLPEPTGAGRGRAT